MTLIISTWRWGAKYGPEYVDRLRHGVYAWHRKPFEWRVFEPEPQDKDLTIVPGCFCRLRMFDPWWQQKQGFRKGDRLVCMDLDSIVTGPLETLFERTDPFTILWGANSENKNPFNGSLMMLRIGWHSSVWEGFSLRAASQVPHHHYPDDQAWIWHMIPGAAGWRAGHYSGVYAFKKPGWPKGDALPPQARLVVFPGWRDPSMFTHLPWVQHHWTRRESCQSATSLH